MANTLLNSLPKNLYAHEFMATKLITLSPSMDVFKAIEVLIKNRISGAPVINDERELLGVFSEKSVMKVLVDAAYDQLPTNRVDAFMNPEPEVIWEDTPLLTIAQIFLTTTWRRLPVISDGRLVGQVSRRDVIKAANRIGRQPSSNGQRLLYLSALRAIEEVPAV